MSTNHITIGATVTGPKHSSSGEPEGERRGVITKINGDRVLVHWDDGKYSWLFTGQRANELTESRRELGRKLHADLEAIRRGENVPRDDALAVIREWQGGGHAVPVAIRGAGAVSPQRPSASRPRSAADDIIDAHHRKAAAKAEAGTGQRGSDLKASVEVQVLEFVKAGRRVPD